MIVPLFQEYVDPPHSRASRSDTILPEKTVRARRFSCFNLAARGMSGIFWFLEFLNRTMRTRMVAPPMGRLIQKLGHDVSEEYMDQGGGPFHTTISTIRRSSEHRR